MLGFHVLQPLATAPLGPAELWSRWRGDAVMIILLTLGALCYARGFARAWQLDAYARLRLIGRAALFAGGLAALLLALASPLDTLTTALLAAHMVQYLLLTMVAPALLILGYVPLTRHAVPAPWARWVRMIEATLTQPVVVGLLDVALLVLWHLPGPYQATMRSDTLRLGAQAGVFLAALLYWWVLRHPGSSSGAGHGLTLSSFLLTSLIGSGFGLLLFSTAGTPWYPIYHDRTAAWGLSPQADQQLAGLILGVLPETVDLLPFVLLVAAWIRSAERRGAGRRGRAVATPTRQMDDSEPAPSGQGLLPNTTLLLLLLALVGAVMLTTLLIGLVANHRG